MTGLSSWRTIPAALVLVGIAATIPHAQARRSLDVGVLLDQYAAAQVDAALAVVANATREQVRDLRAQWGIRGQRWVNAVPADRRQRLFIAAALALEVEIAGAERGAWPGIGQADCAGRCALEWARSLLLLRGDPDEAERAWWRASTAFLEGVRDWRFLHTAADPLTPFGSAFGHLTHGLDRFPGDPHLRLAQVFAVGSRFLSVTAEARRGPLPGAPDLSAITIVRRGAGEVGPGLLNGSRALGPLVALRESVTEALASLIPDPHIGPEARVRLGYLHWTGGADDAARTELRLAADDQRADADVRYLAHFLLGTVAQAAGDVEAARAAFAAALVDRPASQSATLALAALHFQDGDVDRAYEMTRASLSQRTGGDDPWRQFQYGGFRALPNLLAVLRREVRR